MVSGLTKGVEFLFKKNKIDWIKGTARLAGQGKVEVVNGDPHLRARLRRANKVLEAKDIIIATGSEPRSVPGITIDRKRIITSDEAIALKEVPKSLVILGSGAVEVEFAPRSTGALAARSRSSRNLLPRLVPVEDPEAVSAEAREVVPEAGDQDLDGHEGDDGHGVGDRRGHRGADAGRQDGEADG